MVPPFLEHLSFRLGNQLFFIRIEDVDCELEVPGSRQGVLSIAEGMNGHPCVMPMRKVAGEWFPASSGWGLLHLSSEEPLDPAEKITDALVEMTDWELQDFAVQLVCERLSESGRTVISRSNNPAIHPSIWFAGDSGAEWVLVCPVRPPRSEARLPSNTAEMRKRLESAGYAGHKAVVRVASADDPFDPDVGPFTPLHRDRALLVSYDGLEGF